jgi:branched-chain amino acid aminotransferase
MATVFLNGSFLSRDDARISAFDAGFQHAVGLFETMTGVRTPKDDAPRGVRIVHLHEHLSRLSDSARALGLSDNLHKNALAEACERTLAKACDDLPQIQRFRLRLTLTGGDLNMLGKPAEQTQKIEQQPTLLVVAQPATDYPQAMFERGVLATIAGLRINPLNSFEGHKTLNYWPRLRELQLAGQKGAAEALVFQVTNHLAGGCVSNCFLVRDNVLLTPIAQGEEAKADTDFDDDDPLLGQAKVQGAYLPSPVLPGVTRKWVLDWADEEMMDTQTRMLTIDDVLNADEVFLTNSSWGVLPVTRVEQRMIADGVVGPITRQLADAWRVSIR